jgi:hypothetical protein
MSAALTLDPARVRPQPGILLVKIDEILGGTTKGGIFLTPDVADARGGKDTAHGIVLRRGAAPSLRHVTLQQEGKDGYKRPGRTRANTTGETWDTAAFPVAEGDRVYFPRDVPLVFVWEDARYGLVMMDECLFATTADADAQVLPSQGR